jgi:NTE family protein
MGGRVREEMVNSLRMFKTDENVAYFHLTHGLFAKDIEFNEKRNSVGAGAKMIQGIVGSEVEFNITQQAKENLAHIRTDLDSFTDVEAGCLQADGYQMSEPRLTKMTRFLADEKLTGDWKFSQYLDGLKRGDDSLLKQLALGRHQFLKPFIFAFNGATSFTKTLGLIAVSLPFVASLALIFGLINWGLINYASINLWQIIINRDESQLFMEKAAIWLYAILISFILSRIANLVIRGSGKWASKIQTVMKAPMSFIVGVCIRIALPIIFALPIIIYIVTIDRYFIKVMGKLD